jgi:aryl-alcohol dehydrogenase-like predicted oxidoreductase
MITREFGKTGLRVSALGFGAGHIGSQSMDDAYAGTLLNRLVDRGVTLIDTARGYGLSEERIGRHLSWRRKDFVLSTKVGYGIPGHADWTFGCIVAGVEEALRLMRTDRIDIVHLHSCPKTILEAGEVIAALEKCRNEGKILSAAYSGENEALDFAVETGRFDSVECSVNLCDQRSLSGAVARASERGMGVIAKRPVANAPWRFAERPAGDYSEEYWHRWKTMAIDPRGIGWNELALRFTAYSNGVASCIVGTTSLDHIEENIRALDQGPLDAPLYDSIRDAFRRWDREWTGQV